MPAPKDPIKRQEWINKLRVANKKPNSGQFKKGQTSWMKGRKPTKEVMKKISKTWFKKGIVNYANKRTPEMMAKVGKENSKFLKKYIQENGPWNKGIKNPDITGNKHPMWKGGRITNKAGYILIYKPNYPYHNGQGIYVFEHRYIMEQHLGRFLTKNERVHHINGIVSDNRIENLKVMTSGKHSSLHVKKQLKDKTHNFLLKHTAWNKGKKMPQISGKNHWSFKRKISH